MKVRNYGSNLTVIEKICYPSENCSTLQAMRWGKEHEDDALALYRSLFESHDNFQVKG